MRKIASLTIITILILSGCSQDDRSYRDRKFRSGDPQAVAAGERLFTEFCSSCHKRQGRGDYLYNIPLNYLVRSSKAELMEHIRKNMNHKDMPNFRPLTEQEREQLALFLLAEILK